MQRLSYLLFFLVLGLSGCDEPPGDQILTENQTAQPPPRTEREMADQLVEEARKAAIQAIDSISRERSFEPATPPRPTEPLVSPTAPVVPPDGR